MKVYASALFIFEGDARPGIRSPMELPVFTILRLRFESERAPESVRRSIGIAIRSVWIYKANNLVQRIHLPP